MSAPRPLEGFPRSILREVERYDLDPTPCRVDLSDNTNLFGMPPSAEQVLRDVRGASVTRYPPLYAGELKAALARYTGAPPDWIVTGCGSDDVLDCSFRALAEPGQTLAHMHPSFSMVPVFARLNGLVPVAVPLKPGFDLDVERLLERAPRLIYLCTPNNPTATVLRRDAVEEVLERAPGFVLMDEAYAEFCSETYLKDVGRFPRLLVVRTLSKAFGLAGLRVGYAVGQPELVGEVEKARGPYKVNALAGLAATAALSRDLGWMQTQVETMKRLRQRLRKGLEALGLLPLPSEANFLLVPVRDAASAARTLRTAGVAVRAFSGLAGVGDALRITVGPWEQLEVALEALAKAGGANGAIT